MKYYVQRKLTSKKQMKKITRILPITPVMSQQEAQKTEVHSTKQFLSKNEVSKLIKFAEKCSLPVYTTNVYDDVGVNGDPLHTTMYLQTDKLFESELNWLFTKIVRLAKLANKQNDWGFDIERGQFNVRVAEYHEMRPGGALRDSHHYDIGSLITVDIMLQEATIGAVFNTLEVSSDAQHESLQTHQFHSGDALVFVSHKYHCVSPLIEGCRKVLVVEFWSGVSCKCGHRCDHPVLGECCFIDD